MADKVGLCREVLAQAYGAAVWWSHAVFVSELAPTPGPFTAYVQNSWGAPWPADDRLALPENDRDGQEPPA